MSRKQENISIAEGKFQAARKLLKTAKHAELALTNETIMHMNSCDAALKRCKQTDVSNLSKCINERDWLRAHRATHVPKGHRNLLIHGYANVQEGNHPFKRAGRVCLVLAVEGLGLSHTPDADPFVLLRTERISVETRKLGDDAARDLQESEGIPFLEFDREFLLSNSSTMILFTPLCFERTISEEEVELSLVMMASKELRNVSEKWSEVTEEQRMKVWSSLQKLDEKWEVPKPRPSLHSLSLEKEAEHIPREISKRQREGEHGLDPCTEDRKQEGGRRNLKSKPPAPERGHKHRDADADGSSVDNDSFVYPRGQGDGTLLKLPGYPKTSGETAKARKGKGKRGGRASYLPLIVLSKACQT